ncbi:MAG TPA: phosphate-starvation-inducible PsiE family protein [Gallionella sp.]|nr:phosphate-starvation-inducible PsiE family protein [Gallionella sp.]
MMLRNLVPQRWNIMTIYQRFESVVAVVMTLLVSLVIVVAIIRLAATVTTGLVVGVVNPLDPKVFQGVFGEIITVLIALEFNHSLQYVITGMRNIIQTQVILLIALLAIARKFIIMDIEEIAPGEMLGLAAIALALGIVYWLLRDHNGGSQSGREQPPSEKKADTGE